MEQYNNLSVTNGKEALEQIKNLTINEPSGYGIYSTQLKDTIYYFIIKKELDELAKYKRAFEILKKADMFMLEESFGLYKAISGDKTEYFEKEEYELLEELMND